MHCTYKDCQNKQRSRGYCVKHYSQLLRGKLGTTRERGEIGEKYQCPEYGSWSGAITRCYNKKDKSYVNYGGRGIKVCNGIRYSFLKFYSLLGDRPAGMSIDRIDNDANYSCGSCDDCKQNGWPLNIRWANDFTQAANKRRYTNNTVGHKNIVWNQKSNSWALVIERHNKVIYSGYFNKLDDAVDARQCVLERYGKLGSTKKSSYMDIAKDTKRIPNFAGAHNPAATTNWNTVRKIRKVWSEGIYYQAEIMKMFNLNQSVVSSILRNKSWYDPDFHPTVRKRWDTKKLKGM